MIQLYSSPFLPEIAETVAVIQANSAKIATLEGKTAAPAASTPAAAPAAAAEEEEDDDVDLFGDDEVSAMLSSTASHLTTLR